MNQNAEAIRVLRALLYLAEHSTVEQLPPYLAAGPEVLTKQAALATGNQMVTDLINMPPEPPVLPVPPVMPGGQPMQMMMGLVSAATPLAMFLAEAAKTPQR
jgi:hypothetical protein